MEKRKYLPPQKFLWFPARRRSTCTASSYTQHSHLQRQREFISLYFLGFISISNWNQLAMAATLQSLALRSPFNPSISPLNSHTFPSATVNYPSKLMMASKGSLVVTRKRGVSARASNSQYSPTIAENLGDVSIFTAAGDPVMFKDLWDQDQVSMLIFTYIKAFIFTLVHISGTISFT